MNLSKAIASRLPERWQHQLRLRRYRHQIARDHFTTPEPEFDRLHELVAAGDWAIDIGANIGHYTGRLSQLVGSAGRVIAFEPVPETFAILAANARLFAHANVTLFNAGVSDCCGIARMSIPDFASGLRNYYEARIGGTSGVALDVMMVTISEFAFPERIALVKIDAEGHELHVLRGLDTVLRRDRPKLIVEMSSPDITTYLDTLGYVCEHIADSPNSIFRASAPATLPANDASATTATTASSA